MKKSIKVFLSVCLIMFLLAACGSTSNTNTLANETPASNENSGIEASTTEETLQSSTETLAAIEPTLAEGEVIVSSLAEFQAALEDAEITIIRINAAVEITDEISFERNDDLEIHIEKEGTLTINEIFSPVGCAIINDGVILVNSDFERGISALTNNGSITINAGGVVSSGMSDTENHGSFTVESEAELFIDRGSIFNNFAKLTNNGYISIKDGGQLNDEAGSIINNGTIDLYAFFNGDIANISGTGTLNDNRE